MTGLNMAGSDNFCLRLDGFDGNSKIYWQKLQTENDFYDVTIACDDKQIKAHKLVLSSCSPVLRNILKLNPSSHPVIYFRRVRYTNLQNLLDFIYQGEVNVAEGDLPNFLEVAEDLKVRGLCDRNTDDHDSKREDASQFTNQNINISPESKRTSEIEKVKIVNGQKNKSSKASDNSINNCNDKQILFGSNELKNEVVNQECVEDNKKNVTSTIAVPDEGGNYSCGQCDFKTKFTFALKPHIKSVHEGVRYPCDQCSYKASYKHALQRHIKSIHEGESYPCNQCEYKATQKGSLRSHQLKKHY